MNDTTVNGTGVHTAGQFRPDDPEIQKDPYPYYPILREQAPVLESDFEGQPCWILSRRDDILTVLRDPETFSSATAPISNLLFTDPPDHQRLRRMVSGMFTRKAVEPIRPYIAEKIESLISAALEMRHCDFVDVVAGQLTVATIARVLGVGVDDVQRLRQLTKLGGEYVRAIRLGREPSPDSLSANRELVGFAAELVRSSNVEGGGVVAKLGESARQGELTEQECAEFVVVLLVAGHTTTTNLLANSIYMLTERPGDLASIRDDPSFTTSFVEEVLRTRPSFHRLLRVTTREVTLSGTRIPAGAVVRMLIASANRDPSAIETPEVFDPYRQQRMHLAFGQGIHTCVGQWLARLETTIALETIARRVSSITLDPQRPPIRFSGGTFNEFGFEHLPVRLEPTQ